MRVSRSAPPADAKAKGVAYFTVPGADLRMFRCEDQDATLSTRGCADRWTRAQETAGADSLSGCARCPIGAVHAGKPAVTFSPSYGSSRCPRCGYGYRLIGDRVCVSCYNREGELKRARNTRGNRPRFLPALITLPVHLAIDGRLAPRLEVRAAVEHVAKVKTGRNRRKRPTYAEHARGGTLEASMQILRRQRGLVDLVAVVEVPDVALQQELAL